MTEQEQKVSPQAPNIPEDLNRPGVATWGRSIGQSPLFPSQTEVSRTGNEIDGPREEVDLPGVAYFPFSWAFHHFFELNSRIQLILIFLPKQV